VAVVLLPVVLGIGALGLLFNQAHREVFFLGGVLMLGMAVSTLLGKGWSLPMPMLRSPDTSQGRVAGTFLLGVFSGIVSSCCAPVLSGVLVLSATATSLLHVVAIGLAYVLGMVTPLFFAALLWDRLGLGQRDLFRSRSVQLVLAGRTARMRLTDLGASVIFFAMGSLMVGLALTGRATYTPGFLISLNHWGSAQFARLASGLQGVPELVVGVGLLLLIGGLAALAWPRGHCQQEELLSQVASTAAERTTASAPCCVGMAPIAPPRDEPAAKHAACCHDTSIAQTAAQQATPLG
jgi:cytochrome c biogenesis protein CcdA